VSSSCANQIHSAFRFPLLPCPFSPKNVFTGDGAVDSLDTTGDGECLAVVECAGCPGVGDFAYSILSLTLLFHTPTLRAHSPFDITGIIDTVDTTGEGYMVDTTGDGCADTQLTGSVKVDTNSDGNADSEISAVAMAVAIAAETAMQNILAKVLETVVISKDLLRL
jgi:hypothetical protein